MKEDQTRPLASPITVPNPIRTTRKKGCTTCTRYIICSLGTLVLIMIITILVLYFTFFKVKDPIMTLHKISVTNGYLAIQPGGSNISMTADVSVENSSRATFRFSNTTTSIYYKKIMVGEAHGPPGRARGRHTLRMNITVEIITELMFKAPNLVSDISSGLLIMDTYSRVPGRIKVLIIDFKNIVVEMNCTISFNITSLGIQGQGCKRHVELKF